MLEVIELAIPEVKLLKPKKFEDNRGYFTEYFKYQDIVAHGIDFKPMQDNLSLSVENNTLRGLHLQKTPFAQAKLVSCFQGRILDIAVDVRPDSKNYGKYIAVELSGDDVSQLYIPRGFAHGFLTLEPNTKVFYRVDNKYSRVDEVIIKWNDPDLNINWGIVNLAPIQSAKDISEAIGFKDLANIKI